MPDHETRLQYLKGFNWPMVADDATKAIESLRNIVAKAEDSVDTEALAQLHMEPALRELARFCERVEHIEKVVNNELNAFWQGGDSEPTGGV